MSTLPREQLVAVFVALRPTVNYSYGDLVRNLHVFLFLF